MMPMAKYPPLPPRPSALVSPSTSHAMEESTEMETGSQEHRISITPEAVCYRGSEQVCGSCQHYQDGECEALEMPVEEGAGCNLFTEGGGTVQPLG